MIITNAQFYARMESVAYGRRNWLITNATAAFLWLIATNLPAKFVDQYFIEFKRYMIWIRMASLSHKDHDPFTSNRGIVSVDDLMLYIENHHEEDNDVICDDLCTITFLNNLISRCGRCTKLQRYNGDIHKIKFLLGHVNQ